jgi:hypothetical protein
MMALDIASTGARLAEGLLAGRPSVPYRAIRASSLPSFVKSWFHLAVETWYAPEYTWRSTAKRFDFKDEAVQEWLSPFDAAVKDTALFPAEDCVKIIEGALRHEMAYATHPVSALSGLFFQRSDVIDGVHAVDFLTQFQRETYYTDALKTYVLEHDDARLDRELFEQFLANAEREAYEKQPSEALKTAVRAVAEILGVMGGNGHPDQIALDTWQAFLQTRHLDEAVPGLMQIVESRRPEQAAMSFEELWTACGTLADRASETEEAPAAEEPAPPAFDAPTAEAAPAFSPPPPEEALPAEKDTPSAFAPPSEYTPAVSLPSEPEPARAESPAADREAGSERPKETPPLDATISNSAAPPPPAGAVPPPVEISDKLHRMFVKKLFNKDEALYRTVIEQLEPALSWEEAFSIIEEIWQEHGLNLFSKESQEFTRIYYERYFPPA